MNDETDTAHGAASTAAADAAAPLVFDARSLVVKREPPLPPPALVDDASALGGDVHGTTAVLRRAGSAASAFGFVDVADGRQLQQPASAVYHPFGSSSPRLWTTESMAAVADEFDVSTGPRMASCSGGSLTGSDASGRPHTSGVSSEDRSPTSPRVHPLNTVDAATTSASSNFLIGTSCIRMRLTVYTGWAKKTAPNFSCNNFGKYGPILIVFSLLHSQMN